MISVNPLNGIKWLSADNSITNLSSFACPLSVLGTGKLCSCWDKLELISPEKNWMKQAQNCAGEPSSRTDIHSNPSYIAGPGTTSCPAVAQTEGMPPGSITSDHFCISTVDKHWAHWPLLSIDSRQLTSFVKTVLFRYRNVPFLHRKVQ